MEKNANLINRTHFHPELGQFYCSFRSEVHLATNNILWWEKVEMQGNKSIYISQLSLRPSHSLLPQPLDLRTFLSVSPPHWQWLAPMGSWRVWNCTALNLYQKQISRQNVWSKIIFFPPTFLGMGLSLSLILHPLPRSRIQNKIITLKIAIVISDRLRHWLVSPSDCLIVSCVIETNYSAHSDKILPIKF